jgi:hypothetical protein
LFIGLSHESQALDQAQDLDQDQNQDLDLDLDQSLRSDQDQDLNLDQDVDPDLDQAQYLLHFLMKVNPHAKT